jgi:hypothetical protein
MNIDSLAIHRKGKTFTVPSVRIGSRTIVCVGRWLKVASIWDEVWLEPDADCRPDLMIAELQRSPLNPDVFTFAQRFDEREPKYRYHYELDNVAALPTTSFAKWWEQLPQSSRKNARRAQRSGVVVKTVEFDDQLVHGIMGIYNADPLRQTGRFWHFGKSFEVVKKENSTYVDRSCLIGAYLADELIGFIKMVYVDGAAILMQIVAKTEHRDKRPINAMLAKVVEICEQKGMAFLVYGKYHYGNKTQSSLAEFKQRNGFEPMYYPRYYVPLTLKGKIAVRLRLHRGLLEILPEPIITFLVNGRRRILQYSAFLRTSTKSRDVAATPRTVGDDRA